MSRALPWLFSISSIVAALWSLYLVVLHGRAVAHTLEPGVMCGADGGCGDVLASAWSTIGGVPVNAPAVPAYLALAALGALAATGRLDRERVAAAVAVAGPLGVAFGGWLLWHMLGDIGVVCRYCLVADALHLAVTGLGFALHPGGPAAAFREIGAEARRPWPVLAIPAAMLVGTPIVMAAFPEPTVDADAPVEVVMEGAPRPTGGTAVATGEVQQLVIPARSVDVPLDPDVPVKGPAGGLDVVVFADFQCPYCRGLAGNLESLSAERPVRVAFLNFPMNAQCNAAPIPSLHADACGAAVAGVCAHRQGKFWAMHDRMFQYSARLTPGDLVDHARAVGLDVERFQACLADRTALDRVMADSAVGQRLGVTGTPQLYIAGRPFSGGLTTPMLVAAVDALTSGADAGTIDVALTGEIVGTVPDTAPMRPILGGPVSIDAFEASIVGGAARSIPGVEPARGASWYDAKAACEAAGKRLCTEAEWVGACIGVAPVDADRDGVVSDDEQGGRRQPYGNWQDLAYCASARAPEDTQPLLTGNHPRCATPDGIYDLEGGVKEWVGLTPDRAALKGGSYQSGDSARCLYHKIDVPPDVGGDPTTGFRCCQGPPPADAIADHHPGGKVGDPMASWRLRSLDGQWLTGEELRGNAVIVTFWASWCGPCRVEMPALDALYQRYRDQGLVVVGINVDRDPAQAGTFLQRTPVSFPTVMDPESRVFDQFDTDGVPTTFWVTRSGQIRQRTVGYDERHADRLDGMAQALLAAP